MGVLDHRLIPWHTYRYVRVRAILARCAVHEDDNVVIAGSRCAAHSDEFWDTGRGQKEDCGHGEAVEILVLCQVRLCFTQPLF